MEQHTEGLSFWLLGIKLERLEFGGDTYRLNAWPLPAYSGNVGTPFSGDRVLSAEAAQAARLGYWFMDGSHFNFSKNFTRYWHTV